MHFYGVVSILFDSVWVSPLRGRLFVNLRERFVVGYRGSVFNGGPLDHRGIKISSWVAQFHSPEEKNAGKAHFP